MGLATLLKRGGIPITSELYPDAEVFYLMDSAAATLVDQTPNGRDATVTGATTEAAVINNGLFCDGVDDGIRLSDTSPIFTNAQTCFFGWFDPQATGTSQTLLHYASSGSGTRYCGMYVTTSDTLRVFGDDGAGAGTEWDFGAITRDAYSFIVVQQTAGGAYDVWINNSQKTGSLAVGPNKTPWVEDITGACHLEWGNITRVGVNVFRSVGTDHFRAFRRNLTASEIATFYNGGSGA